MAHIPPRLRTAKARLGSEAGTNVAQEAALVRRLLKEAFLKARPDTEAALAKCFASPRTVLACLELLARLEGELT
jgi:hypothetical protein